VFDFYAPWCGHCQELRPEYEKVARALETRVSFGTVDCEAQQDLCQNIGVDGFPQVRLLIQKTELDEIYSGELQEEPIKTWILDAIGNNVVEMDAATFDKQVMKGTDAWLINFSAGEWCGPCQMVKKTMRTMSRKLAPFAKVGVINCDKEKELCQSQSIASYPMAKICEKKSEHEAMSCDVIEKKAGGQTMNLNLVLDLWGMGFTAGARLARPQEKSADVGIDGFDYSSLGDDESEDAWADEPAPTPIDEKDL
jgi:thiol-disulfide isomerase/thioredoxin